MKLFFKYLQSKEKLILLFILFLTVYAFVFWLYGIGMQAIIYPTLLNCILFIVALIIDFRKTYIIHKKFQNYDIADIVAQNNEETSIILNDYQEKLSDLVEDLSKQKYEDDERYKRMVDYYTLWVHQIKTPIASMRLHLQSEDSDLSRQLLIDLTRIEQYVEMVMAFLRLKSEYNDFVFQNYDLNVIISNAIKKFKEEFIIRKISLMYDNCNMVLVTDEKWLQFVIEQIISNSLKYTLTGNIKIYLDINGNLHIEDTGIGIAPEDLSRVFEAGYTGYNGRLDKKASGLGLYLCKKICSNLSIDIHINSALNKGTEVILNFGKQEKI
ncbi:MAG: sensor histidine kinase [Erysipelotrichia bacterium]|nr:sensor histidine kinase [Erysipelotrichia bacterium]